jgi:competence protein ComGC
MNRVKNEQGYALVTVLLIVTIFMVLVLSFMGQAFSSVKQNQVIEKKTQSVAAAEMGISYYQVSIQKIFESKQQVVSDYIKANSTLITNFKRAAAIKMAAELQNVFPLGTIQPPVPIEGHPNASFFIKNFVAVADPDPTSHKVKLSFNIIGTENMKESTLFAKMTIDLDSIINLATVDESNNSVLPTFNTVVKPTGGCITLECDNVYINGNGSFSGNNNIKDNQTIYTTGSLDLDGNGNENNKTNVKIHADGAITIGKNMNSAANVIIETKDKAFFMQNVKISGTSKLLINKTLYVNQNLELADNSFVYVGGTEATIDNNLDILSSSKMCVYGDLKANKITVGTSSTPPSKLIVFGRIYEKGTLQTNPNFNNIDTFKRECGTLIPPEFKIKWGDNVNTIVNNVDYN